MGCHCWGLPNPGIERTSSSLAGGFFTPEPPWNPGQPLGMWINSPVSLYITREILKKKKKLYIAWEVSTKVILYSMTVFCRKYSPHWLLHHLLYPPPFCRHFLSKIPPPCHGFKICSGEECSKDKRFYCKERVPLLQVITFMV